ncbi:DEAD/DEAH box helicase [Niabella aurantiaca]|uniref:DEAD/DEAH box helicase n=1 Tax=Niabella aurantiaca TaxID=379900 RepID=UPI001FE08F80|nr:DEAD/DEAH box helicase [Niabella aurantiaca]
MTAQRTMAILLAAHKAGEKQGLLQILSVDKSSKPPVYDTIGFTNKSINSSFRQLLPPDPVKVLLAFGESGMARTLPAIRHYFEVQGGSVPYRAFLERELVKYYYDLFRQLKPYFGQLKWYHSSKGPNDRWVTAPCAISSHRPFLKFTVTEAGGQYRIEALLEINGADHALKDLERHYFFLRKEQEYFLLTLADHQTLDWLAGENATVPGTREQIETLLSRLEGKYPVKRNVPEDTLAISAAPVCRVLLSELSNTFLMFTPQWTYDGYAVEGAWETQTTVHLNGTPVVIERNQEKEAELRTLLESFHPRFPEQRNGYYYLPFAEAQKRQWFQKVYHKLLVSDIEIIGMDMLQHFRFSTFLPETTMELTGEDAQFYTYWLTVQFGNEKVSVNELQKTLWAGQTAVLLKDGTLGLLSADWMQQYAMVLKHGKVYQQQLKVSKWLQLSTQADTEAAEIENGPESWWQRWRDWQLHKPVYALPKTVNAVLRSYQQQGYEWMCLMADAGAGGCLADDMGLGKTLQAISFLTRIQEQFPGTQSLVVCPASLIYNWEQELKKFAPQLSVMVYHGAQRDPSSVSDTSIQVFVTSYGTLRSDEALLTAVAYKVIFIDESHNIKNPAARITRAVGNINAGYRFALSGTPVVNNTFDLYAQLNTVLPGVFGSREFFKREYADPIDRFGDEAKQQALQKLIAPFVLRRTKEQVAADLPEKTEMVLWCEMDDDQRLAYENLKDQIRSNVLAGIQKNGIARTRLHVLEGILKLRQVCNTPLLVEEAEPRSAASVKLDMLFAELEQLLPGHKVLVFSQFTGMLDIIAAACRQKQIAHYHFDGQTPPAKRAKMVEDFQKQDSDVHLFLISLKAGNAGLTLTAADYVFLFDPWWNEAVQQQAIDRTHRIGQTKNVFAYKMICKDSIEEKILQLQERKKKLSADLISADEGFIQNLEQQDVEWLFG